ncbi:hypothetical protein ANO14919_087800 [Xylariales sp. No.14919]|nr:hypothetical protein ANO14919_087800 [Xylariales sp. No.14919]
MISPSASLTMTSRSNLPSLICLDVTRTFSHSSPSSGRAALTSRFTTTVGNQRLARASAWTSSSRSFAVYVSSAALEPGPRARFCPIISSRNSSAAKYACMVNGNESTTYGAIACAMRSPLAVRIYMSSTSGVRGPDLER